MGGALGGVLGGVTGQANKILSPLGLGGEQGEYFQANNANGALDQLNNRAGLNNEAGLQSVLTKYGNGSQNFDEALNAGGFSGSQADELRQRLATDATTGSKYATEQVQNNPLLSGLYGQGGLQSQLSNEQNQLSNQGFKLNSDDMSAYGQASGDISRQFGQQEQDVSKSLARRGLGGGSSGAAGAAFSGLAGNKNEMLAKAQTDIAQKRYQDTMSRLNNVRSQMQSLGGQASNDIDSQYQRQLAGAKRNDANLSGLAGLQTGANNSANAANQAEMQSKSDNKGQTIFDAAGQGLFSGVKEGISKKLSGGMMPAGK